MLITVEKVLNFSKLQWGGAEATTLASVLPHYVSLRALDMSQNRIGSDGAQRLSEVLKTNSTLLELKYAAPHVLLPTVKAP